MHDSYKLNCIVLDLFGEVTCNVLDTVIGIIFVQDDLAEWYVNSKLKLFYDIGLFTFSEMRRILGIRIGTGKFLTVHKPKRII